MAALNNCMFIGNIGKIETRYLPNGDAVTNFTVAVNESWKSKEGEKQQRTTWVQCVSYRKLAEIIAEYCKTGSSIYVSGKLNISSWEKDGVKHYKTDIIVNELQMLGGKQENRDNGTSQPASSPADAPAKGNFDNFDDDIPFFEPCRHNSLWRVM